MGSWIDFHAPRIAVAILGLAGVVLLLLVLPQPPDRVGPDGALYESLAWEAAQSPGIFDCGNLAHAFWAPGWVATIASLYKAVGREPKAIRVLSIALALATAALVYVLAARVAGRRAGLFAMLFFLVARLTVLYSTFLQYEMAQAFTLVAVGALLFVPVFEPHRRSMARWALDLVAGTVLAASALLSGRALVLLPLVAFALVREAGARNAAARFLIVALGVALVIVPWAARNRRCEGTWTLTTSNGGYNLWLGNNPHSTGGYYEPNPSDRPPYLEHASSAWTHDALRYMAQHPASTASRTAIKAVRFWIPLYADQGLLLAAAAIGLFRLIRREHGLRPGLVLWIVGVPVALTLVQALSFVQARFFVAAQPWVAILAGAGIAGWRPGSIDVDDLSRRRESSHSKP